MKEKEEPGRVGDITTKGNRGHREERRERSEAKPRWRGPIRALRREPAPGTGKHHGKYKGKGKEERNDRYWERRRLQERWRQR